MLKAVVLDGFTTNPGDLSWDGVSNIVNLSVFDRTSQDQVVERASGADIILLNKVRIGEAELAKLPDLKSIFILATGFDNVDGEAAAKHHIPVCNVSGYSTESVAQHVFALLLSLTNKVQSHSNSVTNGRWAGAEDFSYSLQTIPALAGKTLGIFGIGKIGKRVAEIGQAFGMNILAIRRSLHQDRLPGVRFVSREEIFAESDVLSLHVPLTEQTAGLINKQTLAHMKSTALLINTGRGGLIVEKDLQEALKTGQIQAAALDVLSAEPPPSNHPLIGLDNCILTPHIAWAGLEARQRLIEETILNVKAFIKGDTRNQVN